MKLARTVAHTPDVDGMLASIDTKQFDEWMTEFKIEPWGIEIPVEETAGTKDSLSVMRQQAGV